MTALIVCLFFYISVARCIAAVVMDLIRKWRARRKSIPESKKPDGLMTMDVLATLEVSSFENLEGSFIYMNPLLFNKMHDYVWHTIMINTKTMRTIGIIYDIKGTTMRLVSDCLNGVTDVAGLVIMYAREYYFEAKDTRMFKCGLYNLYTMNHHVVY